MIPRFGEPVLRNTRYTLRPGAYAILPRGSSVLLTIEFDGEPDVQLPGGGVDPGESPIRALHREVMEETGWTIARPRRLGAFRRFVFMPEYDLWAEKLCSIYLARPIRKVGPPSEPFHKPIWVPIHDAVGALGNPGDSRFLAAYLRS